MKYDVLVKNADWESVELTLLKYYPDTELVMEKYQQIFFHLQKMQPIFSKFKVGVYKYEADDDIADDDIYCFNVSGFDGTLCRDILGFSIERYPEYADKEYGYSIVGAKWEEWLGMEVKIDCLSKMSKNDFVAHCLWEMTFCYPDSQNYENHIV